MLKWKMSNSKCKREISFNDLCDWIIFVLKSTLINNVQKQTYLYIQRKYFEGYILAVTVVFLSYAWDWWGRKEEKGQTEDFFQNFKTSVLLFFPKQQTWITLEKLLKMSLKGCLVGSVGRNMWFLISGSWVLSPHWAQRLDK